MKLKLIIGFLLAGQFLLAQNPCDSNPKYNEFDFWIGEWDVYRTDGVLSGQSTITKILDNCVILEEWTSTKSQRGLTFTGKSFNSYNSSNQQWQQNWVDNIGGTTEYLTGYFENDVMHFISRPFVNGKNTSIRRLTFYKLNDGKVRQHGEISNDDGKTWTTEVDLEYRPRK